MAAKAPPPTLPDRPAAASADGPATLLVAGDGQLSTHALGRDPIVIGRDPTCDVAIAHPSLSRRHATLRLGPPVTVQDLGSTNGTRVAGALVKGGAAVTVATGESFVIGPFSFVVVGSRGGDGATSTGVVADKLRVDDPTRDRVSALIRDIAASAVNVLIVGETGVGKEVLAATVHALSGRAGPLLALNCAALAEPLLESELFGHEQGAFTGATRAKPGLLESAAGGTVFLDEVGELPLALQAKLLRAVEAREVLRIGALRPIAIDVRFVAATNRDLAAEAAAGRFRADLFYRLDGMSLWIPPLRQRRALIAPLALRFVEAASPSAGARVSPGFLHQLERHDWPGNVRELKAACERAVLLARGKDLGVQHLVIARPPAGAAAAPAPAPIDGGPSDLTPEQQLDRARIVEALDACAGNQTRAAKQLGISRTTMAARLALYRIPRPQR
jgi:two-component system, NtrC family, response regulator AtoC